MNSEYISHIGLMGFWTLSFVWYSEQNTGLRELGLFPSWRAKFWRHHKELICHRIIEYGWDWIQLRLVLFHFFRRRTDTGLLIPLILKSVSIFIGPAIHIMHIHIPCIYIPCTYTACVCVYLPYIYIYIQWNLYKAEPHGTENIFHIGQVSALCKITKKMLNPLKSWVNSITIEIILPTWCIPVYQNRRRWLL
jgi:hypothetical protein